MTPGASGGRRVRSAYSRIKRAVSPHDNGRLGVQGTLAVGILVGGVVFLGAISAGYTQTAHALLGGLLVYCVAGVVFEAFVAN